jgi:phosphohistidine phosphatase
MARELWLLRHGEAEPTGGPTPDAERRLTPRGEEQARAAGRLLQRLGVRFDLIATSPKARALQTAQLATEPLGVELMVHEPLADGFDVEDALELSAMVGDDGYVLAIGHNPDFVQVVHDLTGARAHLGTGAVAAMRLRAVIGELRVLARPLDLEG